MFCPHCGEKLEGNGLFCSSCGKKIEVDHQEAVSHTRQIQERHYHAEKDKGFSYLASYKTIATDILLTDNKLKLTQQITWFVFMKRPPVQSAIRLPDILNAARKSQFDFWDSAFAIMFLIAGVMMHWSWLLLAALFAFTARGEVIKITHTKGVYRIPLSHHEIPELEGDILAAKQPYFQQS